MEFLQSIFSPIFALFGRNFSYAMYFDHYVDSLKRELFNLQSKRDDIKREIESETRQGMEATNEVLCWLKNVDDVEREAAEIIDESMDLEARSYRLVLGRWIGKRADDARDKVSSLMAESSFHKIAHKLNPVRFEEMPSVPTVGMDPALEQLKLLCGDEDVTVIGVLGMGGVGKTTLLGRFNNEVLVRSVDLDVVISVKVSRDFDVARIQRAVGYRLGLSWDEKKTEDERAMVLFKILNKMRFLLLLDDLWQPLDLAAVGIPTPAGKSKIILTTRVEDVCDQMDAKKFRMDCLPWEDAWELFKKKARFELSYNSEIQHYAEDLAYQCGGLPLALITLGRAMASKTTVKEWKHAASTFKNTAWHLLGVEENVLHCLKQSYDQLVDQRLRTCLLYSVLMSTMDVASIHKAAIIELCIGEGIIDDFDDPETAYSEGYHLLGVLKAASLLQNGGDDDSVKIHPLIRTMVSWIVCECGQKDSRWLVQAAAELTESPDVEKWREAERISLASNEISTLPEAPDCPKLLNILLSGNQELRKIPQDFFRSMPCLSILDLSCTSIRELPAGISSLINLNHLNLSETRIMSIPEELKSLIKLRFLILSSTPHLRTIPDRVLAGLTELRALDMYCSYDKWKLDSSGSGTNIQELENMRRLKYLNITVENAYILESISKSRRLATSIRYMHVRACRRIKTIQLPSTFGNFMKGLRCLRISGSKTLEEVVVGSGDSAEEWLHFPNMNVLVLQDLLKARIIFKDQFFPNLRYLFINNCQGIEQIVKLNEVAGQEDHESINAFPHLKWLRLVDLPELNSLGGGRVLAFPSLKLLLVDNCPKLRRLSLNTEELTMIKCRQEWWDELEWDDDNQREALMTLVTPL